jgi:hypothetical protein
VTITSNQPVLASQRVQYYSSFNEVPGIANDRGAKASYFVWYDHVSNPGFRSDNVHVWNEGDTTATGTVTIPGCASATSFSIMPGQYAIATCPTGYGGPVVITSDNPVLASQRVQYYQSFNEVLADT